MRVERYTRTVDDLVTDVIVAPLYEDELPPLGIGGLIDWRLNGYLSRAILSGTVTGKKNELVLLPLQQRLAARRVLFVGLGKKKAFSLLEAQQVARKLGKTIKGLGAIDVALYIPPASDERDPGGTEAAVLEILHQAQLSQEVLLRWLQPPTHQLTPYLFPTVSSPLYEAGK